MNALRILLWLFYSAVLGFGLLWIFEKAHALISYRTEGLIILSLALLILLAWIELLRRAQVRLIETLRLKSFKAERLVERIAKLDSSVQEGDTYSVKLQYGPFDPEILHTWRTKMMRAMEGENTREFDKLNGMGMPSAREDQYKIVNQYLELIKPRIEEFKKQRLLMDQEPKQLTDSAPTRMLTE